MVISAAALLGITLTEQSQTQQGEDGEGGQNEAAPTLGVSASEPVLASDAAVNGENDAVKFSSDDARQQRDSFSKKRHNRRSLGKRSLTLGGRQKSQKLSKEQLVSHLERNFSNIVMLVSKSLDTLSDVFGKNKTKAGEEKAIKLAQQLTFHLSEVNIVITKVANMCDGKTKISSAGHVPDSVDEALSTSKHTLSVLLPKFKKMLNATKIDGAMENIEEGLLEQIDEAMSDAAEQMDNLGNWLKDSGFGAAAGAVMLAMRWKSKAFGKKGGKGARGSHFGSIRIAPGGTGTSPLGSFAQNSRPSVESGNDAVASALASAKEELSAAIAEAAAGEEDAATVPAAEVPAEQPAAAVAAPS